MNDDVQKIIRNIEDVCEQFHMLDHGGKLIVGVSGGADSMALLHFLSTHAPKERIVAAHVNHGIRGEEADRDEKFVSDFCNENEIFFCRKFSDIPAMSRMSGKSEEECGRLVRYEFFSSLAENENDRIFTAHTLSDTSETVLFHLARGTGISGLKGILPIREKICRPLIKITREQVEAYCSAFSLQYCTDSTNMSDEYSRNFIRHRIVPQMKEINPAFENAVLRMTETLQEDEAFFADEAQKLLSAARINEQSYRVSILLEEKSPVLRRALRMISEKNTRVDMLHLKQAEELLKKGRGELCLSGGYHFIVSQNILIFEKTAQEIKDYELIYAPSGVILPDGRKLAIDKVPISVLKSKNITKNINNLFSTDAFDYGIISHEIKIRTRREGDMFTPRNRNITKKLKKLQNELHIPVSERNRCVVLESGGEIVWVEKIGCADRFKITDKTQYAAKITIIDSQKERGIEQWV